MDNETERAMAQALIDAINDILPKTSEKNNSSIKKALDLAAEHYDIKGDTKDKK